MPRIPITTYIKERKCGVTRIYDTDASTFICNTPEGRLLKRPRKCHFYIYNPNGKTKKEKIRDLLYPEAKELIRKFGTREQFCEYFTILNPDGSYKTGNHTHIYIDEVHRIKLIRNASLLGMNLSQTVEYFIDKYDDMRHFNKTFTSHKINSRNVPADLSEFTS